MSKPFRLLNGCALATLVALALMAPLAGCQSRPAPARVKPLVVVTTGLVADVARRVGGDAVDVWALMGPGVDPHLYKPSEGDVRMLEEADLVLYNGLHLEGKMTDVLVRMARTRAVVAVTEQIPADRLREPPEFAGAYDPHVWFDVSLWAETPAVIARELAAIAPDRAETFRANAEAYTLELRELDAWVRARIEEIPPESRLLVTAHDAFGYFGARYGMEVVGIQGLSTASEAGLGDVSRVVDLVVERGIKAIFIESSVPRRSIQAVVDAVRARGKEVVIGGELYSDALGDAESGAGTYLGMVRHNVDAIVEALR